MRHANAASVSISTSLPARMREFLAQIGQRLDELAHGFIGHFGLDQLLDQFAEFF